MENKYKSYSDTYLYQQHPIYTKTLTDAIMKDPIIDKSSNMFSDVLYVIKRAKISENIVTVLNSKNTILLDCVNPLPKAFKVFCASDIKSKERDMKIFIDCTGVIEKNKSGSAYNVDESKLLSYLINGTVTMVYHKAINKILNRTSMVNIATEAYAKCFTQVVDYLAKVSIQESSRISVLYLTSMFFTISVLNLSEDRAKSIATKIAGISNREAAMLDMLMERNSISKGDAKNEANPYENIKTFIAAMRETLHLNKKVISTDMIVERWMMLYGSSTVFAMEYFPHFSAMITDAYIGAYLNKQKAIEKVCGTAMINYSKEVIGLIDSIA